MRTILKLVVVGAVAVAISACGRVASTVVTPPTDLGSVKQAKLIPAVVTSKEQNADAAKLNEQWKTMAGEQLQAALAGKSLALSPSASATVGCRIEVVYGNQALRAFVGYGAGSGHIKVTVELKDAGGKVLYATRSEADLAVGSFGGDMKEVVRNAIDLAAKDFASRL